MTFAIIETLQNCGKPKMIERAAEDVNKAVREINRGKKLTKVDRWTTFLALPASVLEFCCSLPPIISLPLGIYGISSYFSHKHMDANNNWIRIIR